MKRAFFIVACVLGSVVGAEEVSIDPQKGNNAFTALFDAKLGERISATSSSVGCELTFDEKAQTVSGTCSVPLTSIKVDNEDTKTEHFQQWTTNKKSDPKACKLEAKLAGVKVGALAAQKPTAFTAEVAFTVCGRPRTDGAKEHLTGTAMLFPPGSYGDQKTIRIRANIEHFNRAKYQIGPGFTEGWLSRVQSLAPVVAEEGTIDFSLFAHPKQAAPATH